MHEWVRLIALFFVLWGFISDKIHLMDAVLMSLSLFLLSNGILSRLKTLPLASFDAIGVSSEAVVRNLAYLNV